MDNIEFTYLYRDGGNYKKHGKVIFSNTGCQQAEFVSERLKRAFLEDGLFIASQIRLPETFLYAKGALSADDHCFHEFDAITLTNEVCNDPYRRSISDFIAEVEIEAAHGWRVFDPYDSKGSLGWLLAANPLQ